MTSQPTGEGPNSAFDLFDRWMSNREPVSAAPEPGVAPGEVVISDTKASREAARRLLEAAQRGEEPPHLAVAEPDEALHPAPGPVPADPSPHPDPAAFLPPEVLPRSCRRSP